MGLPVGARLRAGARTGLWPRAVDGALAVCLAAAPLAPNGFVYAGLPRLAYVDLVVCLLVVVWAAGYLEARGRVPACWPVGLGPWHVWLGVTLGAALLALMAEHRLWSPVFAAQVSESAGDLFRPMNHGAHPLYPLRVALNLAGGWLALVLIGDLCRRAPNPARRATIALGGWFAGFALVSGFALLQYFTRFRLHPYWVKANPNIVRAHATLEDPNALGAYLLLGIGLLTGLLLLTRTRRWLWSALLALGVAALITTMSRAAFGAWIMGTFTVLAFLPSPATRLQRAARLAGRAAVILVVALLTVSAAARLFIPERTRTQPKTPAELLVKTFDPRESFNWVLRGRVPWWQAATRMTAEHPFTGVGLGRYPRLMTSYGGGVNRENAHNFFLQTFAETGVLGGIAFLALCGSVCLVFRRMVTSGTDHQRALALGGLIGTVAFLMTLITGHALLLASGQILWASFTILLAACAGAWSSGTDSAPAVAAAPRRWAILALAIAAFLWYPVAGLAKGFGPRPGTWGYSWGLYPVEESAPGVKYRWTSARAIMEMAVPRDAIALEWPLAVPQPVRAGSPVRLEARVDGALHEMTVQTAGVVVWRLPLDPVSARRERVTIDLRVVPTFVPSREQPPSGDHRELGVQLFRPQFVNGDPPDPR